MMFKKIFLVISILFYFSIVGRVNAEEILEYNYDDFSIVDNITLYNKAKNTYYVFNNEDDLQEFMITLTNDYDSCMYACLPGDHGYPNCDGNAVVNTTSKTLSTTTTDYRLSSNYLLGNNGWVYGPGNMSLSIAESYGVTFGITHNEVSGNFNFSVTVTSSYGFDVDAGYKGNIKYKCKLKIVSKQYIYTLENGNKINGPKYNEVSIVDGTGGFTSVIVKA